MKTISIRIAAALAWTALAMPHVEAQTEAPAPTASAEEEPRPMMGVELDDGAARGHFQVAQALFRTGRYVEAGDEFEQAYRLSHRSEMLFNAFVAYRDGADFERATESLARYLETDPENPGAPQLSARLERMRARLAEQDEVETQRQRAVAGQAQAEHERQEAEARADRERQRANEATRMSSATRRAWVVTASGGGLILASGVLALIAKSRVDGLEANCPNNRCPSNVDLAGDRSRARRAVIATDALWISGAAVAILGFVLLLTANSDADEPATRVGAFCDGHGCAASYRRAF
ncbi:MAG: hypothetical protein GXP55_24565 [Deltaproteobacteria bacterium]|nr:hypothetical protein [Deltaproteobacteria bacterium]